MRFGPCANGRGLPFKPATLPDSIYGVRASRSPKIREHKLPENKSQLVLVNRIKAEINPLLFTDPHIFPCGGDILLALAGLTTVAGISLLPQSRDYVCLYSRTEKTCKLLDVRSDRDLAVGDPGDLLAYASKYYPRAVSTIINAMRMLHIPSIRALGSDGVKGRKIPLQQLLSAFRKQRAFNAGLDRISKCDEMKFIDKEHVINKFQIWPDDELTDECYHLGAGNSLSASVFSLNRYYSRVICIDPRLDPDSDSIPEPFDCSKLKPGRDIYSDVAYGDAEGMIVDGVKQLVEDLYQLCNDRIVIVKCALVLGINARAIVRTKPRPHNLEIILELNADGDPLDDIYGEYYPMVIEANEKRNRCVFTQTFSGEIKPLFNSKYDIRDLCLSVPRVIPRVGPNHPDGVNKNQVIHQFFGGTKFSDRLSRFLEYVTAYAFDGVKYGKFAIMPESTLHVGNVTDCDPGFPCPKFSAASLVATIHQGKQWKLRKANSFILIRKRV